MCYTCNNVVDLSVVTGCNKDFYEMLEHPVIIFLYP